MERKVSFLRDRQVFHYNARKGRKVVTLRCVLQNSTFRTEVVRIIGTDVIVHYVTEYIRKVRFFGAVSGDAKI